MIRVLPAIIPSSKRELLAWLDSVDYASMVQVDIVDGVFAAPASWPFQAGDSVDFSQLPLEHIMLDMMVAQGAEFYMQHQNQLQTVAELVVHFDSLHDITDMALLQKHYGGRLLLAVMNTTPSFAYEDFLPFCHGVQVMGIAEVGKQGQGFSPETVVTVARLREMYPELDIVVDGSVNESTLEDLVEAGVSRVVVGSALKNAAAPSKVYRRLEEYFPDE